MAEDKEPNFFSLEWPRGLDWYESLFEGAEGFRAIGEASVNYSEFPDIPGVPERIAKVLPDVRLIYLVRHPIERMRSQYQWRVWRGFEHDPSMERVLLNDPTYVDTSRYAMQVERYLEHFAHDQLLILISEELKRDRAAVLRRTYRFLGVDAEWLPPNVDDEWSRTEGRRIPRRLDRYLRSIPGYETVASVAPISLKRVKYRATTRPIEAHPELPEELQRELSRRLEDDVRRLRGYAGTAVDQWRIA